MAQGTQLCHRFRCDFVGLLALHKARSPHAAHRILSGPQMGLAIHGPKTVTPDQESLSLRQTTLIHITPCLFRYGKLHRLPGKSRKENSKESAKACLRLEPQTSTLSVTFDNAVPLVQPCHCAAIGSCLGGRGVVRRTTFTAEKHIEPRDCLSARLRGVAPSSPFHGSG